LSELSLIQDVRARKVFDSRGTATIEVEVETSTAIGRASAPAGKSRGKGEVVPYPEGGVDKALSQVEDLIASELTGMDSCDQTAVDAALHEIDGTHDFSVIGGNAACATSLAAAEAGAHSLGLPLFTHLGGVFANTLPLPLGNVLGGGSHAGEGAPDIQEFLVVPLDPKDVTQAVEINLAVHRTLGQLLSEKVKGFTRGRGDEGAFAPNLDSRSALEAVREAVERVSQQTGAKIGVGLDMAASSLWDPSSKVYVYRRDGMKLSREEQIRYVLSLVEENDLLYVEDPLEEKDFEGFAELTASAGRALICGDDLFVTNLGALRRGVSTKAGNAIIIKLNQVGTVSDASQAARFAKESGYLTVASHRSGETESGHLAHIAVAFGCGMMKSGVIGGERIAKANELLRIAETLGETAEIARTGWMR